MGIDVMAIDKVLDLIVPLDFGLDSNRVILRRVIKFTLMFLILTVIAGISVEAAIAICPVEPTGWSIGIMAFWYILVGLFIYCLTAIVLMSLKGTLKTNLKELENLGVTIVESESGPQVSQKRKNIFFFPFVNEPELIEFIKSHQDKFVSSEDMALLFLIMRDKDCFDASMKKFHDFLSSLIPCKSYKHLSEGRLRVKEILGYHDYDESRQKLVVKYDEMEEKLQKFIMQRYRF